MLVVCYYFLVLNLMGDWLFDLFKGHRHAYAAVALALVVVQGVCLDLVTTFLVRVTKSSNQDE